MYLYTKNEVSESLSEKATTYAMLELEHESEGELVSKKEEYEKRKWHVDSNMFLLNKILDQFKMRSVKDPYSDRGPITEWRHEISSDIAVSSFNGLTGHSFLSVNNDSLAVYLDWYFDTEMKYQHSDALERWIVDMLIYSECRTIALECTGRLKNGVLNSLPFFLFGKKRKLKLKLLELLPKAVAAYRSLDPIVVDWSMVQEALNKAYVHGVEWRHPLPNFVARLANRRNEANQEQHRNFLIN